MKRSITGAAAAMEIEGKAAAAMASSTTSTRATIGKEKDAIRAARASMVASAEVARAKAAEAKDSTRTGRGKPKGKAADSKGFVTGAANGAIQQAAAR